MSKRKNTIKIYLTETGHKDVDWIYHGQDRNQWWALVNLVLNLRVLQNTQNFFIT